MISLDTNVLVRYLVRDDVQQAEVARALLESLSADGYQRVGEPLHTRECVEK